MSFRVVRTRYHSRVFDYLAHPNLSAALATDWKWPFKLPLYLSLEFSRVPFTLVLILLINTTVNGTLLNFSKRYKDGLKGSFLISGQNCTLVWMRCWNRVNWSAKTWMCQCHGTPSTQACAEQSKNLERCLVRTLWPAACRSTWKGKLWLLLNVVLLHDVLSHFGSFLCTTQQ